jgi:hypothetical protein
MIIDTVTAERIDRANDIYDDINRLNRDFTQWARNNKRKWIFSLQLFEVPYLLNRIVKFETEGAKLLALLGTTTDFKEAHDFLCEFSDLVRDYRATFITYMNLAKLHPSETPEDLFDIYTYGGAI